MNLLRLLLLFPLTLHAELSSWDASTNQLPQSVGFSLDSQTTDELPLLSNGTLNLFTDSNAELIFYQKTEASLDFPAVTEIAFRLQVLSNTTSNNTRSSAAVGFSFGSAGGQNLWIGLDSVFFENEQSNANTSIDTDDTPHDYLLRINGTNTGDTIELFQDNALILTSTVTTNNIASDPRLFFGDLSPSSSGSANWSSFSHNARANNYPTSRTKSSAIIFTDANIEPSEVTLEVISTPSATADPPVLSSNGTELLVDLPLQNTSTPYTVYVFHNAATLTPANYPGLSSFRVQFRHRGSSNRAVRAIARQGSIVTQVGPASQSSTNLLVEATFSAANGLDFSATAPPIEIGFYLSASQASFTLEFAQQQLYTTAYYDSQNDEDLPYSDTHRFDLSPLFPNEDPVTTSPRSASATIAPIAFPNNGSVNVQLDVTGSSQIQNVLLNQSLRFNQTATSSIIFTADQDLYNLTFQIYDLEQFNSSQKERLNFPGLLPDCVSPAYQLSGTSLEQTPTSRNFLTDLDPASGTLNPNLNLQLNALGGFFRINFLPANTPFTFDSTASSSLGPIFLTGISFSNRRGSEDFPPSTFSGTPSAWCSNTGWHNFAPDPNFGVSVNETHLAGYAWNPNTGWLRLGDPFPSNGHTFTNTGSDHGVNHDGTGLLSGYAWSPNTGWLNFGWATANDPNAPQFSLLNGQFSGYAWNPNTGWVNLGTPSLLTDSLTCLDSDLDNIADRWELDNFGNLTTAGIGTDFDDDGQTDAAESIARTDPKDSSSYLSVVINTPTPDSPAIGQTEITLAFLSSQDRLYEIFHSTDLGQNDPWTSSNLGQFPGDDTFTTRTITFPNSDRMFFYLDVKKPLSN
ncbi:MAG: hypothetical protein AAGC74_09860 [Verrucomicrobiota bacterium]